MKKFLLYILIPVAFIQSCNEDPVIKNNDEKAAVEKTIRSCIGWAGKKDLALLHSVIVNDSTYLEVDPQEGVVKGFEQFRKAEKTWMSPDFQAVRYEIRDLRIDMARSGDVAWWFCILDDINTWRGEPASWLNTRWTGVAEKRKGKWVIVQQHFSFAAE